MLTKTSVLKTVFGFDNFRPLQEEVIDKILNRQDALLILPTGGGKSLCYQLPALMMPGVLVVISPLLALMQDQVLSLQSKGVAATMISSMQTQEEISDIKQSLLNQEIKILFISPERLQQEYFLDFLKTIKICFFAIDEAHCVSEWGHEFRADYRELGVLKNQFKDIGIAAFTATATKKVEKDIVKQLRMSGSVIRGGTYRENLFITATPRQGNGYQQLLDFLKNQSGKQGIIYTLSRKNTEDLAQFLTDKGFNASAYHAGIENDKRIEVFKQFNNEQVDIIVATIAFGMGIDKSNIRFVVHMSLPKTIESYYQEIGRAGRDGLPSQTLLLYSVADIGLLSKFIESIEDVNYKNNAYTKLNLMKQYAFSENCRHKILSTYFDDKFFTQEKCKTTCDNCLNPNVDRIDISKAAQMFLSTIYHTKQNFGINHIIDILLGSKNAKVLKNNHQELSVYGIGVEYNKTQWKTIADRLLEIEAITIGEFQVLHLTNIAKDILKLIKTVNIRKDYLQQNIKKNNTIVKESPKYQVDDAILSALKELRRHIARSENIPAYIVFDDKTLLEMAYFLPNDKNSFLKISGVGDVQYQKYGSQFIDILNSFRSDDFSVEDNKELCDNGNTQKLSKTYLKTLELIQNGFDVENIVENRELAMSTILGHINKLVEYNLLESDKRLELFAKIKTNKDLDKIIDDGVKITGSIADLQSYISIIRQLKFKE